MRVTIEVSRYKKSMCISLHQRGHHLISLGGGEMVPGLCVNFTVNPNPSAKPATVPLGPKMHHQLPLDDHQPWDEAVRFSPSVVMTGSSFHFSWHPWGPYKFHDQHTRTTELRKNFRNHLSTPNWGTEGLILLLCLLDRNMLNTLLTSKTPNHAKRPSPIWPPKILFDHGSSIRTSSNHHFSNLKPCTKGELWRTKALVFSFIVKIQLFQHCAEPFCDLMEHWNWRFGVKLASKAILTCANHWDLIHPNKGILHI